MTVVTRAVVACLLVVLLAVPAGAQELTQEPGAPARIERSHDPRLALTAAFLNIGYVPLRLAITAVGAVLGGFTGFITFGDLAAAQAVWGLTDGPMVITPEMLLGTEPCCFNDPH